MKNIIEYNHLLEALRSRAAVKSFEDRKDGAYNRSGDTRNLIDMTKEIIRLTPSSYGLQPYKFLFITNKEILSQLKGHSYQQPQITDAYFLVVFCVHTQIDEKSVDRYLDLISHTRGVAKEKLEDFRKVLNGSIQRIDEEGRISWATKQAYIALGNALTSLSLLGIDTCPMEGFDPQGYDEVLGLSEKKLRPVVLMAVGKRSAQDPSHSQTKVRFPTDALCLDYD